MDEDYDNDPRIKDEDSDGSSSASSESEESLPLENQEADSQGIATFGPVKIATANCIHAYIIDRMKGAEDYSLPWPTLMLIVLDYFNKRYKRRELVTERNIGALELLLKVPIQIKIDHTPSSKKESIKSSTIDLNDDSSIDFGGMSFVEALEILKDLLQDKIIKPEHIRDGVLPHM